MCRIQMAQVKAYQGGTGKLNDCERVHERSTRENPCMAKHTLKTQWLGYHLSIYFTIKIYLKTGHKENSGKEFQVPRGNTRPKVCCKINQESKPIR